MISKSKKSACRWQQFSLTSICRGMIQRGINRAETLAEDNYMDTICKDVILGREEEGYNPKYLYIYIGR